MVKKGRMVGAGMQDLVSAVAAKAGITKENAHAAIKAVREGISELLKQSGRVQISMFGSFTMKETAARQGRNPATGEVISIPAGRRIGFKVSKTWKDSIAPKQAQAEKKPKPAAKAKAKPSCQEGLEKRLTKEKTMDALQRTKRRKASAAASESVQLPPAFRVLFSPKAGISKELVRLTQAAAKEIDVAAYAFSSKYLGKALVSAMKRGVKIRVILDFDVARKTYSIDEWLIENGIEVRFIKLKRGCLHHKFMLIDCIYLMTGSYNFTNESEFRNHEAAIFIDAIPGAFPCTASSAADLIAAFSAEYERLWSLTATA